MAKKQTLTQETIDGIIKDYTIENMGIYGLCEKYHLGKIKVKQILADNNIPIKKKGAQEEDKSTWKVSDYRIPKYENKDGYHYEAILKTNPEIRFKDCSNKSGYLTNYIKKNCNVEVPSTELMQKYYMRTGNYWWEQFFDVEKVEDTEIPMWKCPYCTWSHPINKRAKHVLIEHIQEKHEIGVDKHLENYPQDKELFIYANKAVQTKYEMDETKFVKCQMCGEKFHRIDGAHLKKHNMTLLEYKLRYGTNSTLSQEYSKWLATEKATELNLALENIEHRSTSQPEKELKEFIKSLGFDCHKNRTILNGKELDIFIPECNIAIEYNGNQWHSERFGNKDRHYHLNKLNECNSQGVRLIQICEDEYVLRKSIVESKLKHILGKAKDLPKIYARNCIVREIENGIANEFLDANHIQGSTRATIYLGAFYNEELVGVLACTAYENENWELVRFATKNTYHCVGVGSKLFKKFVSLYQPATIKSFADRRWTISQDDNLYIKLGFHLEKVLSPDYKYYWPKLDRYRRFHKFRFRKTKLAKKYNLPIDLTENEMATTLGMDKIWDCGLYKYVWENKKD